MVAKNNGFVSVANSVVQGTVNANSVNYESYAGGVIGMANQHDGNWSDFVPVNNQTPDESSLMSSATIYNLDNCVIDCNMSSTASVTRNISCLAAYVSEYVVVGTNYVSSETNVPTSTNGAGCDTYKTRDKLLAESYLSGTVGLDFVNVWVSVFNKPEIRTATPYIATKIDTNNKIFAQLVGFDGAELYAAAYTSGTERMVGALYFPYSVFGYEPQEITFDSVDFGKIKLFALGDSLNPLCECIEI